MIGLHGWVGGWSGSGMQQRGGGPGEAPGDREPENSRPTGRRRRPADRVPQERRAAGDHDPEHGPQQRPTAEGRSRGGRVGVTYKYFGAPDGATAARVPISMRPEELGGDELGQGMYTKVKPETMAAMVLTGIEGIPPSKVPPLELVVLHPDYAVVRLPALGRRPAAQRQRGVPRRRRLHLVDGPRPPRPARRVRHLPDAARVAGLRPPLRRIRPPALLPGLAVAFSHIRPLCLWRITATARIRTRLPRGGRAPPKRAGCLRARRRPPRARGCPCGGPRRVL